MRTQVRMELFFLMLLSFVVMSCSVNVEYEAPRDQLADMCSGNFGNTPSTCVDTKFMASGILNGGNYSCQTWYPDYYSGGDTQYWNPGYFSTPIFYSDTPANSSCNYIQPTYLGVENNNALILVTEAGYINASATNLAALKNAFPAALAPYFRTLQNNILSAYFSKMLEVNIKKYGRIYLVRSDVESKSMLLSTISRVTNAHNKVDMFLAIHGNAGEWDLDPNLSSVYALKSSELMAFANSQLTQAQRDKVRAVFSTACYADSASYYPSYLPSMAAAISQVFPYSVTYGSPGVNWAPMHRDFTAFEAYYAGAPFYSSILNTGNYILNYNQATGAARTALNFPTLLGRGCWFNGLWTDCANQSISMGSFGVGSYAVSQSVARISNGVYGNIYGKIANTCTHPDTGAQVLEGTAYTFYSVSSLPSNSVYTCSNYRTTVTCTAYGWSAAVPATHYASCVKQSTCPTYKCGILLEP